MSIRPGGSPQHRRRGRASGVDLDPNIVQVPVDYIEEALEEMRASMHAEILAGRPLELEALNGAVVRAGKSAGLPTPINGVIYAALNPSPPEAEPKFVAEIFCL